jgi:hypothetical protein
MNCRHSALFGTLSEHVDHGVDEMGEKASESGLKNNYLFRILLLGKILFMEIFLDLHNKFNLICTGGPRYPLFAYLSAILHIHI